MNKPVINDTEKELMGSLKAFFNNETQQGIWVTSAELEEIYNVTGQEIRNAVNKMRQWEYPLLSSSKGYKKAETIEELDKCISNLYSRIYGIAQAARGLTAARDKYTSKQLSFKFKDAQIVEELVDLAVKSIKEEYPE